MVKLLELDKRHLQMIENFLFAVKPSLDPLKYAELDMDLNYIQSCLKGFDGLMIQTRFRC